MSHSAPVNEAAQALAGEYETRVLPTRMVPAWVLSCLLHGTLITIGAFTLQVMPRGFEEQGRGGGIVLVASSSTGKTAYFSESAAARKGSAALASASPAAATKTTAIPLPGAEQLPQVASAGLPQSLPSAALPGSETGLPNASGLIGGAGTGTGVTNATGQTTLNVFGVAGTGSRFVYVFDRSSSMSGYEGRPLAAAKAELLSSLKSLEKVHQFQIIFYNEEPHIFNAKPGQKPTLYFADEAAQASATAFVENIVGDGGTQHLDALLKALSLNPDVIFFLTDANDPRLTEPELQKIRERNRGGTTVIHCIEFGAGPSQDNDNFLHRLAKQNRGSRVYIDVTKLPANK
jgi:hypothetical protein